MYFIHICSCFTYLGNRKGVFTSVPVKKWPSMTIFKIYDFEYVTYTNTGFFKACTIQSSWDTEWDRQKFLSFWAIFALLYTPEKPGKSKFGKNEKSLETRHYPFINVYHKWWRSYDVYIYIYIWLLRYKVDKQNLLSCWAIVCNFDPFWQFERKTFFGKKMKKIPADIII